MHDRRRLTDKILGVLKTFSTKLTLQEEIEDGDKSWDKLTKQEIYMAGFNDGKIDLAKDILEHQDLINYN